MNMKFTTHVHLGALLYSAICETWNIPLDRKRFLYGCVKPDFSSLLVRHPHFYRISRKFVFKKMRKLVRRNPGFNKRNRKFSEDLGIVLHYVADFFTTAHNRKPNRLQDHIDFENMLDADFLATVRMETVRYRFRFLKDRFISVDDAKNEIVRLHRAYRGNGAATADDIREIISACVAVTAGIMNEVSAGAEAAAQKPADRILPISKDAAV